MYNSRTFFLSLTKPIEKYLGKTDAIESGKPPASVVVHPD
jgi:hypothetical protein